MGRIKCTDCGQRAEHYARDRCERCWRNLRSRERWATMSRQKRMARLKQMREAKKRRKGT